ncbi:S24 family peptidase [Granulibacter bethesdensis]|uniref:S24 family peptidase n=1 Tax=Granulibacter bethesdensis TaxID=364410 RepID=UPI000909F383|nr:S24 family peptidase [Granulibacter bethesdensis]APH60219.1 DNA-binding protein RDGA [Granulibacter bethesdensis]
MKHEDIWRAIDTLAAIKGLSTSGLARRAGLDATTFNLSKRQMPDGRQRWPSTESISKILVATGESLGAFTSLVNGAETLSSDSGQNTHYGRRIPLFSLPELRDLPIKGEGNAFPSARDETSLPDVADREAYGIEIHDTSLAPLFREGTILIVSPNAPLRRGDRVIVRLAAHDGEPSETVFGHFHRRSARWMDISSLNGDKAERSISLTSLVWIHRIVWASQ